MRRNNSIILNAILCIVGCILSVFLLFIAFFYISPWIFPSLWGSYSLGKNLYLVTEEHCFYHENKRFQGYVILQGTQIEGKVCHGGEYVVPTYENYYDSIGNYREFVTESKHNDNWIIIKTYIIPEKRNKYYIIRKDFDENISVEEIVSKHVKEFETYHSFIDACNALSIDIRI
jgi:hypothetical protein